MYPSMIRVAGSTSSVSTWSPFVLPSCLTSLAAVKVTAAWPEWIVDIDNLSSRRKYKFLTVAVLGWASSPLPGTGVYWPSGVVFLLQESAVGGLSRILSGMRQCATVATCY
jgi:hypothetical protein